jgi:GNAT superfamily N-acetyltransferase
MTYSVEVITPSSQGEMLDFLKSHENYSLFLLSNFENYGAKLTEAPYSGNYKLIRLGKKVVGVFCLSRNGSLLIESTILEPIFDTVLDSCRQEPIPLKGVVGNWEFCSRFWEYLKNKKVIRKEIFKSKEILYTLDLKTQNVSDQSNVRLLTENDYDQWKPLRLAYLKEMGIPHDHSDKQLLELFLQKTTKRISWGCFLDGTLVSIADLNAKALDLGQVGGVYTDPKFRRQGCSSVVMKQLLHDVKTLHSIRKLIIFTGEDNISAQQLYLSLGVSHFGYFTLLFGEP